jgi:hypothetical protein
MLAGELKEEGMTILDDDYSVEKTGFSRTEERREGWLDGEVATPWGFVVCYAQGDKNNVNHTRLDFIHDGRLYTRSFLNKRFTQRGIKTKAMQFAKEIAS